MLLLHLETITHPAKDRMLALLHLRLMDHLDKLAPRLLPVATTPLTKDRVETHRLPEDTTHLAKEVVVVLPQLPLTAHQPRVVVLPLLPRAATMRPTKVKIITSPRTTMAMEDFLLSHQRPATEFLTLTASTDPIVSPTVVNFHLRLLTTVPLTKTSRTNQDQTLLEATTTTPPAEMKVPEEVVVPIPMSNPPTQVVMVPRVWTFQAQMQATLAVDQVQIMLLLLPDKVERDTQEEDLSKDLVRIPVTHGEDLSKEVEITLDIHEEDLSKAEETTLVTHEEDLSKARETTPAIQEEDLSKEEEEEIALDTHEEDLRVQVDPRINLEVITVIREILRTIVDQDIKLIMIAIGRTSDHIEDDDDDDSLLLSLLSFKRNVNTCK